MQSLIFQASLMQLQAFAKVCKPLEGKGSTNSKSVSLHTREHASHKSQASGEFSLSHVNDSSVQGHTLRLMNSDSPGKLQRYCSREHCLFPESHMHCSVCVGVGWGVIGTVPSDSTGPEFESKYTVTATGRLGGHWPTA